MCTWNASPPSSRAPDCSSSCWRARVRTIGEQALQHGDRVTGVAGSGHFRAAATGGGVGLRRVAPGTAGGDDPGDAVAAILLARGGIGGAADRVVPAIGRDRPLA